MRGHTYAENTPGRARMPAKLPYACRGCLCPLYRMLWGMLRSLLDVLYWAYFFSLLVGLVVGLAPLSLDARRGLTFLDSPILDRHLLIIAGECRIAVVAHFLVRLLECRIRTLRVALRAVAVFVDELIALALVVVNDHDPG